MKNIYALLLTLTVVVSNAFAQTEEGVWMVGGNVNINTGENATTVELTPSAAFFVMRNLAIGGNITISFSKLGENKLTRFGVGPMTRWYFGKNNNVKPFAHGEFGIVSLKTETASGSSTDNGIRYLLALGLAGFLNPNVALEALAGYDHVKLSDFEGDGGFAFRLGFQVYLRPRQAVDQIKSGL
ncbi:MAG TPA: hypothetical protein VFZ42_11940 [Chitinophagaceae bacterium]